MTRAIAIAVACAAGACGGSPTSAADAARAADARGADASPDAVAPPDAPDRADAMPMSELACLGHAAPAIAPDPLVTSGKVFAIVDYQAQALAHAPVALRRVSDDGVLGSATTAADGSFTISIASGGVAPAAYYLVDDGVHRATYAYPEAPVTGAVNALIVVADDAELARWYADAGDTWDATQRTAITTIVDCATASIAGSVTPSPAPAHTVYYDPTAQRWSPALTASPDGFTLLTRAAATVDVTAHAAGDDFPAHAIATRAGALTLALLPPTE